MTHNPEMVKIVVADVEGWRTFWPSEHWSSDDCLDRAGEYSGTAGGDQLAAQRPRFTTRTAGTSVLRALEARLMAERRWTGVSGKF